MRGWSETTRVAAVLAVALLISTAVRGDLEGLSSANERFEVRHSFPCFLYAPMAFS